MFEARRRLAVTLLFGALGAVGCRDAAPPPAPPRPPPEPRAPAAVEPPPAAPAGARADSANEPQSAVANAARFVNVAEAAGLTAILYCGGPDKTHILESVGSGCAWIDFDEDGLLDAFFVNAWALDEEPRAVRLKGHNVLYRNLGQGRFEDVTDAAGVGGDDWGCGVCAADYDNDGHVDLFVTNFGSNRLYRNRGNGTFEELAERAGVTAPGWNSGAAFFDADGDGWLDLYVAQYIDCTFDEVLAARRTYLWRGKLHVMDGPFGFRGGKDHFFRNNRDGTFTDATDEGGMADLAESYGLGVLASDLDGDGDVDVYVANDSNPNFLYRNDGNGSFTEMGGWSGAGVSEVGRAQGSMGVDAADIDGDGQQDLIVTNFAYDYSTIYHNEGSLLFSDISIERGLKYSTHVPVSWGCAFLDYDLDARLDLLVLNGHIYPQVETSPDLGETYRQLPVLLHDVGGKAQDVSRQSGPGLQVPESMRGLAVGDYDDDGRPDLLITAIDSPPLLLHNETEVRGHWCKVRLLNRHGSPAVNATAKLTAGGKTQMREVRSGSTYCSQNSFELLFGLGSAEEIQSLEIRWPGGRTVVEERVPVDQTVTRREPSPDPQS